MLHQAVVQAFAICLASAPDFRALNDRLPRIAFQHNGVENSDSRWRHAEGMEVFRSETDGQRVCSVWFNDDYSAAVRKVDRMLRQAGFKVASLKPDNFGSRWRVSGSRLVRLMVKEGDSRRLGVALFVSKG